MKTDAEKLIWIADVCKRWDDDLIDAYGAMASIERVLDGRGMHDPGGRRSLEHEPT